MVKNIFYILFLSLSATLLFAQETRILRYPHTSSTEIAFNYAGNIYVAPLRGGTAHRVTNFFGTESGAMPRFSPDGKTIAFTAKYNENHEIYTIASKGGEPVRITYSAANGDSEPHKIIMQWTNDGQEIIYRSCMESWDMLTGKLYKSNINDTAFLQDLPMPSAGYCSVSLDGAQLAYNRIFRDHTDKYYRGGQADDIWIYDFKSKELKNISNNPAQDIIPMWTNNKIYYLSDRDKTMNLFCYEISTEKTRKVTHFSKYDIKFPSLGSNHIVFENGGRLFTIKLISEEMQLVDIKIDTNDINLKNSSKYGKIFDEVLYKIKILFNNTAINTDSIINKYSLLLPYVTHYNELTFIINEMLGELNTKGTYFSEKSPEIKHTKARELRYLNWLKQQQYIVDSVSGGRIEYRHLRENIDIDDFLKNGKDGLIIDNRYNYNTNVSIRIIDTLHDIATKTGMQILCLTNELSNDEFPAKFRETKLGLLVGKSTAGEVGTYKTLPLSAGCYINIPEVEDLNALVNISIEPDIEVNNNPANEYEGIDEQLLFGIKKLLEFIPIKE